METLDPIEGSGLATTVPEGTGSGLGSNGASPDRGERQPPADGDGAIARLEDELTEIVGEISNDLVAITRDLSELVELRRGLDFDFERLEASLGLRGGAAPLEPAAPPSDSDGAATDPAEPDRAGIEWDVQDERIALTMAVNGASREETARYLENNFDLSGETLDRLLRHVYDCVDELRG